MIRALSYASWTTLTLMSQAESAHDPGLLELPGVATGEFTEQKRWLVSSGLVHFAKYDQVRWEGEKQDQREGRQSSKRTSPWHERHVHQSTCPAARGWRRTQYEERN